MSKRLYRYIGFEDFVNLLVNNKDRFVRPVSWDDKYEGCKGVYRWCNGTSVSTTMVCEDSGRYL